MKKEVKKPGKGKGLKGVKRPGKSECVYCKCRDVVKRGRRKTKSGLKQVYYCKKCNKKFIVSSLKGKSFDACVVLSAISYYNLGNTLEESSRLVERKFKVRTSKSAVHKWLHEFRDIYSYHRLRERVLQEYGRDVIASKLFRHRGLTYNYKYHKAKLEFFGGKHDGLAGYLKSFGERFPHRIFEKDERCSQVKVDIKALRKDKNNYACKLAGLALSAVSDNRERHELVENFMLVNDTATVAVEVPVWFWEKKIVDAGLRNEASPHFIPPTHPRQLGVGICGHIDILQLKWREIYVLDFKPEAAKEDEQKVCSQLYLYALGLSFRTGINLGMFRCAWFDADNYFEFEPAKAEVRWSLCKK